MCMYFKCVSLLIWSCQQLIVVDELKNDYRNPVDFASNLNMVSEVLKRMCVAVGTHMPLVGVVNFYYGRGQYNSGRGLVN